MTVKELITKLKEFPEDMEVYRYNDNGVDYDASYEEPYCVEYKYEHTKPGEYNEVIIR